MTDLKIQAKPVGNNGLFDLRNQIAQFVEVNFRLLYEGGVRLGVSIPADYYAAERVQINKTRLHASRGLKYADGHYYAASEAPTEEQLRNTVADIQQLIDAASEVIPAPFTLEIKQG